MNDANMKAETDLILTRVVDVPCHLIWKAWTTPSLLEPWFCPRPYGSKVVQMDVRPGGIFHVLILDPEGNELEGGPGCYLEVVENERLTWTSALCAGYRPVAINTDSQGCGAFPLTATLTLEALGEGSTRYTARALHANAEDAKKHEAMGFYDGWSTVLDQLVEYIKTNLM
ncbi:MAG: SRPBCC family protein [Hahellaceae bacterium]|nr:SRPBCC family protein [Hahellaceae bacterium]